jgi:hypothetical protein
LPTALLKSDELISQIHESHGVIFAAQLECEEAAIKLQCLVDIAHFQRDVIEAY